MDFVISQRLQSAGTPLVGGECCASLSEVVFFQVSVWEHTVLTRALVNESSRYAGHYIHRWSGELPALAERLLEQHALLNGLNKLQLAAM